AGTCRGNRTWRSPAAARRSAPATSSSATTPAHWSSRRRWPRNSSTPRPNRSCGRSSSPNGSATAPASRDCTPSANSGRNPSSNGGATAPRATVTTVADDTRPGASKSTRAYETIKSRITDGAYGPGHRLVLGQLARELEVSPVPIREAIRLLEAEGFVEFERNVGAQVSAINPVEYSHTMETLAVVEGAATGLAAPHLTTETIDHAAELNDRLRISLRDFDPVGYTKL